MFLSSSDIACLYVFSRFFYTVSYLDRKKRNIMKIRNCMSVCVCACWFFFENTLTYIQRKKEKRRKKDNDNTKKK